MKRKNVKFILGIVVLAFASLFFSACGKNKGQIIFKTSDVVYMTHNQVVDIEEYVTFKGCKKRNVVFESSDLDIVFVSPKNELIAGDEDGTAVITAKGYDGFLEIQVSGSSLTFSKPQNLRYDNEDNKFKWDEVYVSNVVANVYNVKVVKNNVLDREFATDKTFVEINEPGDYRISVSCEGRNGIQGSSFSEEYCFTVLSEPQNLVYNDETQILKWQSETCEYFYVSVNGVMSDLINVKEYKLDLSKTENYDIRVFSAGSKDSVNVFGNASSSLTLARLNGPTATVLADGVIWTDNQAGVNHYVVNLYKVESNERTLLNTQQVFVNSAGEYKVKYEYKSGEKYVVSIQTIGDNGNNAEFNKDLHYLNSAPKESMEFEKLDTLSLKFDKEEKRVYVENFDIAKNLSLTLYLKHNEEIKEFDISKSGEKQFDFAEVGEYELYLFNNSKNDSEITSFVSNSINVIQLDTLNYLTQSAKDGKYVINNLSVQHATSYDVVKVYNSQTSTLTLNEGNFGNVDELFKDSGKYEINITANGTDTLDTFIYPSVTKLNVERLDKISADEETNKFVWQAVESASQVEYLIKTTGAQTLEETIDVCEYDYSSKEHGKYYLEIFSVAKNQIVENTLVLNSLESEKLEFEIYKTLNAPTLKLERNSNGYEIDFEIDSRAKSFEVWCNGELVEEVVKDSENNIAYDVSNCFKQAGTGENLLEYNFEIVVKNSDNEYLITSEKASLNIKKLNVVSEISVKNFEINANKSQGVERIEILINNQETNVLTGNSEYNIKVKNISDLETYDNVVYIDGDYAEFKIENSKSSIRTSNLNVTWGTNAQNASKYLIVKQGNNTKEIDLAGLNNFDLKTYNFELNGFDLNEEVEVYLSCRFGDFNIKTNGAYVDGSFVSGVLNDENYEIPVNLIDSVSNSIYVKNLSQFNLGVSEVEDKVNISLLNEENHSYTLHLNGNEVQDKNTVETNIVYGIESAYFTEAKKYNFILNDESADKNVTYLFNVTRLDKVGVISVSEEENISTELIRGANAVYYTYNNNQVTNLNELNGKNQLVIAKFIAGENIDNEYFLDSLTSEFVFERISTYNIANLNLSGNKLQILDEEPSINYSYNIAYLNDADSFESNNANIESVFAENPDKSHNEIDFLDETHQYWLSNLGNDKYLSIKKEIKDFIAASDKINYLSSYYSELKELKVIKNPVNVKFEINEDDLINQNFGKLTWTVENIANYDISGYEVEIIHNGQKQVVTVDGEIIIDESSDIFKEVGNWKVRVKALSLESSDSINSFYSETFEINRLAEVSNFLLNKQGELSWAETLNVSNYYLEYSYFKDGVKITKNLTLDNSKTNSTIIKDQDLLIDFDGDITISLVAVGDGQNYLSSIKTINYERLEKPTLSIHNKAIYIENYESYPENTKFVVKAFTTLEESQTYQLLNKEMELKVDGSGEYYWEIPTTFTYVDNNGTTKTLSKDVQHIISFKVVATNNNAQLISSYESLVDYTLEKLNAPNLVVKNDRLVVSNYLDFASNTTFNIEITTDIEGETYSLVNVKSLLEKDENNEYVWKLPTSFKYLKNGETIFLNTLEEHDLKISVFATNEEQGYVKSEVAIVNVKTLKQATNLRFIRDNNDVIHFYADNNNDKAVDVDVLIGGEVKNFAGNVDLPLTEEILNTLDKNWTITVQAKGSNVAGVQYINAKATEISGTKLGSVSGFVTQDGFLKWSEVKNATEYKVCIGETNVYTNGLVLNDELFGEDFASGKYILKVKSLSNINKQTETTENVILDGLFSEEFTVEKLKTASLTVENDRIVVENYSEYPENTKFNIELTIDVLEGETTKTYTIEKTTVTLEKDSANKYVWKLPTTFKYTNEIGQTITLTGEEDLNVYFFATNEGQGYVKSNVSCASLRTLPQATNLRFLKDADGFIHFYATNPNVKANGIVVTLIDSKDVKETANGSVDILITENILAEFKNQWTLSVQTIGSKVTEGYLNNGVEAERIVNYINLAPVTISGIKLPSVNDIKTSDGNIVWDEITYTSGSKTVYASDYKMIVDNSIMLDGYQTVRKEPLKGPAYASGEHTVKIKAIGNVITANVVEGVINTEVGTSENVVLDADYSSVYNINKMQTISNFHMENGYFVFDSVANASNYVISVYSNLNEQPKEYNLTKFTSFPQNEELGGTLTYYYSQELVDRLNSEESLYVKVYVKTIADRHVYSDFSPINVNGAVEDYIVVKKLKNEYAETGISTIKLVRELKEGTQEYDYTKTLGQWGHNTLTSNGYLLNVDGKLEYVDINSFVLDSKKSWAVGNHNICFAQLGSSSFDEQRTAYITADFSDKITITKLAPVTLSLKSYSFKNDFEGEIIEGFEGFENNIVIQHGSVNSADKYYVYIEDQYYSQIDAINGNYYVPFDNLPARNQPYSSLSMQAISESDINTIASDINYLYYKENKSPLSFSKVEVPEQPEFTNGSFYWTFTDLELLERLETYTCSTTYKVFTKPFPFSMDIYNDIEMYVKFVSKYDVNKVYTYASGIEDFILITEEQYVRIYNHIENNPASYGENALEVLTNLYNSCKGGFSSDSFNFSGFANNLPSGAYEVFVATSGFGMKYYVDIQKYELSLSSDYVSIGTKYITTAPSVIATATQGTYSLIFNNVNVDTNYYDLSKIKYNLFGIKVDEQGKEVVNKLTFLEYGVINDSKPLSINLTNLIQSGILTSEYTQLFIAVAGDSKTDDNDLNHIMNGKVSNFINIKVLDPINAKVEKGLIKWVTQKSALNYLATFTTSNNDSRERRFATQDINIDESWQTWDCSELTEDVNYGLKFQALGMENARIFNSDTLIMSGKITNLGKITRLIPVSTQINSILIERGEFVWSVIENATSYDVYCNIIDSEGKIAQEYTIFNTKLTNYEPNDMGINATNSYMFRVRSIGTEQEQLNENSSVYVNSSISSAIFGRRTPVITSLTFENGLIKYTTDITDGNIGYKLTFTNANDSGDKIVVYTNKTEYDTNSNEKLKTAGNYYVSVQIFYGKYVLAEGETDYLGKVEVKNIINKPVVDDVEYSTYYLISGKTITNFTKLDAVTNINVKDGEISWVFNNDYQMEEGTYKFVLEFNNATKGKKVIEIENSEQRTFSDVVYDDIATEETISLTIYVVPTSGNYVKSTGTTYENTISQYQKIDSEQIVISLTQDGLIKIDWSKGVSSGDASKFTYQLAYKTDLNSSEYTIVDINKEDDGDYTNNTSYVFTDTEAGNVIRFKLRIIPSGENTQNMISSCWTADRDITKPAGVQNLRYDNIKHIVEWDKYEATLNSFRYKITDEVTVVENGVTKTEAFIYILEIGNETYIPSVVGKNKISVAVLVLGNSETDQNTNGLISETVTLNDIEFNLFESGRGTESDPYVINNAQQFNNMKYRMTKDQRLNSYYYGVYSNGELLIEENKTQINEQTYYFKQQANITLEKSENTDNTLSMITEEFNNVYDGDNHTLTLSFIFSSSADYSKVSVFGTLGKIAVVKNLKLLINIPANGGSFSDSTVGKNKIVNISGLCCENKGTISRVVIGNEDDVLQLNTTLQLNMSLLVGTNYGTISEVENKYNITISDLSSEIGKNISVAGLVLTSNGGTISKVKNSGNITISGMYLSFVGGVVGKAENSIISECANIGDINLEYVNTTDTTNSYVGGLIGINSKSAISYCYVVNNIKVSYKGNISTVKKYVGGLIGSSQGNSLSNIYVNVTRKVEFNGVDYTNNTGDYLIIRQLIGNLNTDDMDVVDVYYKAQTGFDPVNYVDPNKTISLNTYTTSPKEIQDNLGSDQFGNETKGYTYYNQVNPRLIWEIEFDKLTWK